MATNSNNLNNVYFDSFFQSTVIDNNGILVTDINAGLRNLFVTLNDEIPYMTETSRHLCTEAEEAYPDLLATHSILGGQQYWWWILLFNKLENPFTEILPNWIYSIVDAADIENFIDISNTGVNNYNNNDRFGTVVELN